MMQFSSTRYIGKPVQRLEDRRFLTGSGQFVDDVVIPDMVHMAIFRSPHAHARINSINLSAARTMKGVLDVFSANEIAMVLPDIPIRLSPFQGFERFLQKPIAKEKVRYVGEPIAVVVAENPYLAEDALGRIVIDFDVLPAVTKIEQAELGEVLLHESAGENLGTAYRVARGDIEAAFKNAPYIRRERFITNRQAACPLETRGLIGEYDRANNKYRLTGAAKVTYFNRRHLAAAFGMKEEEVELIELDVGGGFGARGELYPEDYLVLIASHRIEKPVKWIEDRRENLMACNHSRDITCDLEIAATKEGVILGMKSIVRGDLGAYIRTNGGTVPSKTVQFLPGPYRIPAFASEMRALITNKTPVGTLRGPGRFEATFCRERLLDMMAGDLGIDPAELRLKNLMCSEELPYRTGELVPGDADAVFDEGDYASVYRRMLKEIGYDRWKNRQGEKLDGKFMGLGTAIFIENSAAGPPEKARITIATDGGIEVRTGGSSVGQGLETGMAQICSEFLGTDISRVTVRHGSTTLLPDGGGTFHSRCTVMAGNAVRDAAEHLKERCIKLAALRWNEAAEGLIYENGFVKGSDGKSLSLQALADFLKANEDGEPLSADGSFSNDGKVSYSYGAHAALVAVDSETGEIKLKDYVLVEEIGRALNPALVHGQALGGIVQGLGGTLLDHMVYDEEGQLLTTNLADYLLPISMGLPKIKAITLEEWPSKLNPLGFKGAGEGGVVAVAGAVGNAVAQALHRQKIKITRLPLSPAYLRGLLTEKGF